jgi:hypothetical protein
VGVGVGSGTSVVAGAGEGVAITAGAPPHATHTSAIRVVRPCISAERTPVARVTLAR